MTGTESMRVLLITNDYPPRPGGIQQFWSGVVGAFPHPLRVLAPTDPRGDAAPGDVVRHPGRFLWPTHSVKRWISAEIERFSPDVILFGAPHPLAMLGPRMRIAHRLPYGVMCHGAEVTIPAAFPISRQMLRRALRAADVLFAVSRFTARRVRSLTERNVGYVGAGVDVDTFTPAGTGSAGAATTRSGSYVVGCVSRLVPRKGQSRLLRAIARLRTGGHDVEAVIVGKGRSEKRLRRLARRLDVPCRFEIDVPWDRLGGLYRGMDAFAMPCRSRWLGLEAEGLGIVYLEAAATGIPVVAGTSGGAPETVVPGRTGFVASSVSQVEQAITTLMANPAQAAALGAAGRERVVTEFVWEKVAARFSVGLGSACDGFEDGHHRRS